MNVSEILETEEDLLTCLYIKFYHPKQHTQGFYSLLPLGNRSKHSADTPLLLGRDVQVCTFPMVDRRVSRKQLAFHAYRMPGSPDMQFTLQNLSKTSKVYVNSSALDFLERVDLPSKALVRFMQYEMLITKENGEAKGSFEVELDVLPAPPLKETFFCEPSTLPVMETGSQLKPQAEFQSPLETDETYSC
ncbi:TRAF-interacting protein with FHA domain-containing protein A-like [Nerophis ophidion]|uniref:TRAF-interacting protein with FHA domain-containing protein A-like n=1 Tax=Nerophis ophidion TaxID=159077 RepID=UPI002ADF9D57|nr:TRAF-interacting protein with FHA domain-containing protein A-like [Nerophis ophidion]